MLSCFLLIKLRGVLKLDVNPRQLLASIRETYKLRITWDLNITDSNLDNQDQKAHSGTLPLLLLHPFLLDPPTKIHPPILFPSKLNLRNTPRLKTSSVFFDSLESLFGNSTPIYSWTSRPCFILVRRKLNHPSAPFLISSSLLYQWLTLSHLTLSPSLLPCPVLCPPCLVVCYLYISNYRVCYFFLTALALNLISPNSLLSSRSGFCFSVIKQSGFFYD